MNERGRPRNRRVRLLIRHLPEAVLTLLSLEGQDLEGLLGDLLVTVAARTVAELLRNRCGPSICCRNKKRADLNFPGRPSSMELERS